MILMVGQLISVSFVEICTWIRASPHLWVIGRPIVLGSIVHDYQSFKCIYYVTHAVPLLYSFKVGANSTILKI